MNGLETKIVTFFAMGRNIDENLGKLEAQLDSEFFFAIKTAKDWGQISGIPETVMDICARSTGIDFVATRGPRLKNPVSGKESFSSLLKRALNAAQGYSNGEDRREYKAILQNVYLAIGDLVNQEWKRLRK